MKEDSEGIAHFEGLCEFEKAGISPRRLRQNKHIQTVLMTASTESKTNTVAESTITGCSSRNGVVFEFCC